MSRSVLLLALSRCAAAAVNPWPLPRADVARTARSAYVGPRALTPIPASSASYGHGALVGGDPASYASNVIYTRVCFSSCTGDAASDDAMRYVQTGSSGDTRRGSGPLTSHALPRAMNSLVFMQNQTVFYIQAQRGAFNDERWRRTLTNTSTAIGVLPTLGAVLVPLADRAGYVALDGDTGEIAWTSSPPVPTVLFPNAAILPDAVVDEAAGRLYQLACVETSLSVVTVKLVSGATTGSPTVLSECTNFTSLVFDDGLLYATGVKAAFTSGGTIFPSFGFVVAVDPNDPGGISGAIFPGVRYVNETLSPLACGSSFCAAVVRPAGDVVVLSKPYAGGPAYTFSERVRVNLGKAVGDVAPVVDANGAIYVSSLAGDLFALNPVTGAVIASAQLGRPASETVVELALTQGLLIVTTSLPSVYAIGSTPATPAPAAAAAALPAAGVAGISVVSTLAVAGAAVGMLFQRQVLQIKWHGETQPLLAGEK